MAQSSDMAAMQAELARLREENERLAAKVAKATALRCKVSEKGGESVYGLMVRFPVTLYKEQWDRLFAYAGEVQAFAKEHTAELSVKN